MIHISKKIALDSIFAQNCKGYYTIMENHAFFAVGTFSKIKSYLYQFYCSTVFIIFNLQKDFHQDNLSFLYLQFYKHNRLNILAGNICFHIQAKNR